MKKEKWGIVALLLLSQFVIAQDTWDDNFDNGWKLGNDEGIAYANVGEDIWVFKLDQNQYSFSVVGGYDKFETLPTHAKSAAGAINLNMFTGGELNGYTKIREKIIQPKMNPKYNAFIVWDADTLRILDRTKESMSSILKWPNISQNIRMITEDGKRNRWSNSPKRWSVSILATTTDGHVLFIHSRFPYTMHSIINILLADKRLKIYRAVYLEGGPESSLGIYGNFSHRYRGPETERMGSYETDFNENDDNKVFWPIPFALVFR